MVAFNAELWLAEETDVHASRKYIFVLSRVIHLSVISPWHAEHTIVIVEEDV